MTIDSAKGKDAEVIGFTESSSDTYSITINNKSGSSQSYSLFAQVPTVKPSADTLSLHAILVARGITTSSGTAIMTIPKGDYYAVCGVNYQDEAVQMLVLDRQPVSLGPTSSNERRRGTTCFMKAQQNSLSFDLWKGPGEDKGEAGSFCVQTGADFTYYQAKNSKWGLDKETAICLTYSADQFMIALGLASSGSPRVGIYASFVPVPRTLYQITPSKVFYVVPRALAVNKQLASDVDFSQACQIDFSLHPRHVVITHNDDSTLAISDETPSSPAPKL